MGKGKLKVAVVGTIKKVKYTEIYSSYDHHPIYIACNLKITILENCFLLVLNISINLLRQSSITVEDACF